MMEGENWVFWRRVHLMACAIWFSLFLKEYAHASTFLILLHIIMFRAAEAWPTEP